VNAPYLDTSALAKWYLNESGSEEFETFLLGQEKATVSRLGAIEFRCLLARRRRARELSATTEQAMFEQFRTDVLNGHLEVHPLLDEHAHAALGLLERMEGHPLRTLDALHLAIASALGATVFATADRVMAQAAAALGLRVEIFG
jgi:predicted nucleic acid-binding protein